MKQIKHLLTFCNPPADDVAVVAVVVPLLDLMTPQCDGGCGGGAKITTRRAVFSAPPCEIRRYKLTAKPATIFHTIAHDLTTQPPQGLAGLEVRGFVVHIALSDILQKVWQRGALVGDNGTLNPDDYLANYMLTNYTDRAQTMTAKDWQSITSGKSYPRQGDHHLRQFDKVATADGWQVGADDQPWQCYECSIVESLNNPRPPQLVTLDTLAAFQAQHDTSGKD